MRLFMVVPMTPSAKIKLSMKKLLCSIENKQEVLDYLLPFAGSALKKCSRFTGSVTEIRESQNFQI
jgi:hypothetical protein